MKKQAIQATLVALTSFLLGCATFSAFGGGFTVPVFGLRQTQTKNWELYHGKIDSPDKVVPLDENFHPRAWVCLQLLDWVQTVNYCNAKAKDRKGH